MSGAVPLLAAAAILVLAVVFPVGATAHERGSSAVLLTIGPDIVEGQLQLPIDRLAEAINRPLSADVQLGASDRGWLVEGYVVPRMAVSTANGVSLAVAFGEPFTAAVDGAPHAIVPFTMARNGGDASIVLEYDVIGRELDNHTVLVSVAAAGGSHRVAGTLSSSTRRLALDLDAHERASFTSMVRFGFEHVGSGADHLLFLLVLLLPAPLVVSAGRWAATDPSWRPLLRVIHVVTAFTVGHSVTLVASALGWIELPSRPVEVLIALSVGVSAVHAIRPLVKGGEPIIAASFGLVHGLAFAAILHDVGVDGATAVGSLFGFNVGVELAQLAAVGLLFPSLYALSCTRVYGVARIAGAVVALAAACGWILERVGIVGNPLGGVEEYAIENPVLVAAALCCVAALAVIIAPRRARPREASIACDSQL